MRHDVIVRVGLITIVACVAAAQTDYGLTFLATRKGVNWRNHTSGLITDVSGDGYSTIGSVNCDVWTTHIGKSGSNVTTDVNASVPKHACFKLAAAGFTGMAGWRRQIRPRHALSRMISRVADSDSFIRSSSVDEFPVPPAELLKAWADTAIGALPGEALSNAANYLHDCLRELDLSFAQEQSEFSTLAARKFTSQWIDCMASFLTDVWDDENFSDGTAARMTQWVGEELLAPLIPNNSLRPIGGRRAKQESNTLLRIILSRFSAVRDTKRARVGLCLLAGTFGLHDDEYVSAGG